MSPGREVQTGGPGGGASAGGVGFGTPLLTSRGSAWSLAGSLPGRPYTRENHIRRVIRHVKVDTGGLGATGGSPASVSPSTGGKPPVAHPPGHAVARRGRDLRRLPHLPDT